MRKEYDKVVDFQPIPEERRLLGMRLLKRIDNLALYVTDVYSFEIHMIRVKENFIDPFSKTLYKKIEVLASSKEFGVHAWCYERLSTVFRYFGIFGECSEEILDRLEEFGFVCVKHQGEEVEHGYLF